MTVFFLLFFLKNMENYTKMSIFGHLGHFAKLGLNKSSCDVWRGVDVEQWIVFCLRSVHLQSGRIASFKEHTYPTWTSCHEYPATTRWHMLVSCLLSEPSEGTLISPESRETLVFTGHLPSLKDRKPLGVCVWSQTHCQAYSMVIKLLHCLFSIYFPQSKVNTSILGYLCKVNVHFWHLISV